MSPLPLQTLQMVDWWADRREPEPGQARLCWHLLMSDQPQAQALASVAQRRLAGFPGLHLTPLQRLHMTVLALGLADELPADGIAEMVGSARRLLAALPSVTVTLGEVLYWPESIALGIQPAGALDPLREAVAAAASCLGRYGPRVEQEPWTPHLTLAYSAAAQPAEPIVRALGRELLNCPITLGRVSLIAQAGPERQWNWRSLADIPFGA